MAEAKCTMLEFWVTEKSSVRRSHLGLVTQKTDLRHLRNVYGILKKRIRWFWG